MKDLIKKTKDFFVRNNCFKAVLGLSGGVDSAVVAKLLAEALGRENVTALIMPEKGLSKHTDDATEFAKQLGIAYQIIEINPFLEPFKKLAWQSKLAEMNTKARIRAVILYDFANSHGALVAGTSNKTEIMLGYGTKYGDAAADVYIIGGLYKTEVFSLAKELGVPDKIVRKVPTAELFEGQTDEGELGARYADLDKVLEAIEKEEELSKFDKSLVKNVLERIKKSEHKRKTPEVI